MTSTDPSASGTERLDPDPGASSRDASRDAAESLEELVMNKLERLAAELRALGIVF
jgi:hypothetical protein